MGVFVCCDVGELCLVLCEVYVDYVVGVYLELIGIVEDVVDFDVFEVVRVGGLLGYWDVVGGGLLLGVVVGGGDDFVGS